MENRKLQVPACIFLALFRQSFLRQPQHRQQRQCRPRRRDSERSKRLYPSPSKYLESKLKLLLQKKGFFLIKYEAH